MSKFQGQERQEDLDLGWDSFKYRNYDYAIGRFFNVDPLAEKFPYNGVYNFSENRVVDASELEGKESVIEIYDADNNKTVLDQSNYSNEDWQNIRQAYFDMTRTRENGGGDWVAYSQRQTPPEMGTLSLYYGDDGLSNVSYQSPGMGERFGHNLEMGAKGFYTFFVHSDPLVEGSAESVQTTNNIVYGSSLMLGGMGYFAARAGALVSASRLYKLSSLVPDAYSVLSVTSNFMAGDTKEAYSNGAGFLFGLGTERLLKLAIMNDTDFSKITRFNISGTLGTQASNGFGLTMYMYMRTIFFPYLEINNNRSEKKENPDTEND